MCILIIFMLECVWCVSNGLGSTWGESEMGLTPACRNQPIFDLP